MSFAPASLSSTRITAPLLALLVAGVLATHVLDGLPRWLYLVPLGGLAVNLFAALLCHRAFRAHSGLLVFHICLLLVLIMLACAQLVAFSGRLEISEDQEFDPGDVQVLEQGVWHRIEWLAGARFRQGSFEIRYGPGLVRGQTRSTAHLVQGRVMEFGDTRPLELNGYRFYTTANKGFSAVLRFHAGAGSSVMGSVNFPSFPLNDWRQLNEWVTPRGERIRLELMLAPAADKARQWRLDSRALSRLEALVVHTSGGSARLRPGESMPVRGGTLVFVEPRLWMGYRIVHEPLLSLILATALIGIMGLGWHVLRGTFRRLPLASTLKDGPLGV